MPIKYPFDYGTVNIYSVRVKYNSNKRFKFRVCGTQNGQDTYKDYSFTGTGNWQEVIISMNFDMGSDVYFKNYSNGLLFDTMTYIGRQEV